MSEASGTGAGEANRAGVGAETGADSTTGAGTGRTIEQRGLWFEEFEIGTCYLHRPGRTVTEADNVLFTTLTMNSQALHLDAAWSATQPFGQRLFNSMFTLSTMVGASVGQLTQGTLVANLGFGEVSFPNPLFHGDTMYSQTEVLDKRLSASRPGQGIVTLLHTATNQDGVEVARATRTVLMWCEGRGHDVQDLGAAGDEPRPRDGAGHGSR